jgi:uncharacterized membrane protein YoaK (UPF0700 family)
MSMMNLYNKDRVLAGKDTWPWYLLAFQAGAINSAGYLACHRFVSHVTGFGTRIGTELGTNNTVLALEMSFKFFFFLFGALLVGFIFYKMKQTKEEKFLYSISILILFLITVTLFGEIGLFGTFGEPLLLQRDIALLCALCFICGIQNGATSIISSGLMRTTHLTGLTTDLGTGLAKAITEKDKSELRLVKVRAYLILNFTLGALLSALYSAKLEFKTFLIPTITSTIILGFTIKKVLISKAKKEVTIESMA